MVLIEGKKKERNEEKTAEKGGKWREKTQKICTKIVPRWLKLSKKIVEKGENCIKHEEKKNEKKGKKSS